MFNRKIGTISKKIHTPYEGMFGLGGQEYEKEVTGTGYIDLTNAIANKLLELKAYGGTEQDGTPTPTTPIDIVCNNGTVKVSPNLLDRSKETKGQYINKNTGNLDSTASPWAVSDYIPVVAGSNITISGITYTSVTAGYNYYNSGETLVSTIPYETGTHTYTVPSNASYIRICYRYDPDGNVQIEQGSTATAYMPYGQIYTNGTVETIEVHSKNLFDYRYFYDNYQDYSTSAVGRCPIKLKPNTTYTVSTNRNSSTEGANAVIFVVSGNAINWTPATANNGITSDSPRTVTTDSAGYLCFGIYVRGDREVSESEFISGTTWVQLEQGSTATTYEPYYNGGTATAEMLLKVGDYTDVQSVLDGAVTRNIGIYVLDGTETWIKSNTYTGSFYTSNLNPPDGTKVANNPNVLCSHGFKVDNLSEYASAPIGAFYWYATATINYKYDDGTATLEQFKQWLVAQYNAGTPVIVVYPLATPTTESVSGQTMNIQKGTNTIEITQASIDDLQLYAKYEAKS